MTNSSPNNDRDGQVGVPGILSLARTRTYNVCTSCVCTEA